MQAVAYFVSAVLRGVGQVMFQNNFLIGVLFLLAMLINSLVASGAFVAHNVNQWMLLIGALPGTAASPATTILLGAERGWVSTGL
jgi:urea transporter